MHERSPTYDPIQDLTLCAVYVIAFVAAYAGGWFIVDAGAEALAQWWGA